MGADPKLISADAALSKDEGAISLCREVASPVISEISELIKGRPDSIEAGLVSVDFDLFIPSVGEVDLVAVSKGRLVLVSIFAELTADHLGKAAGIRQWAHENATVLKRVYLGESKEDLSARIIFLCSEVDQRALLLMKMIADLPLELYRYRCLESGANRWIAIEKIASEKKNSNPVTLPQGQRQKAVQMSVHHAAVLTEEEIGEFFDMDAEEQEFGDILVEDETTFSGPYFNS